MKRDSLLFRFFKELPGCFFRLIGRTESDARRYRFDAIEYKETAVRLDGVFLPRDAGGDDPAYLLEAQYYSSERVYANLMSKIGRFLEHGNPRQEWVAVVVYPNRALEQKTLRPYRCLLESDQLIRVFLDELPPAPPDQFEMGVLELIAARPGAAMEKARSMVPRLKSSNRSAAFQRQVVQFIETVILYQFPKLSRREIETMLQVSDVRETRVFQEALEEGVEKGRVEGIEQGLERGIERGIEQVAIRMLKLERPLDEIADATGLGKPQLRKLKQKLARGR